MTDRTSEGGVILPPAPQDWSLRSKGELVRAFFERLPKDDESLLDMEKIEQASAICRHLRDRAIEKNNVQDLRDVHTMMNELGMRARGVNLNRSTSPIQAAGGLPPGAPPIR
jgi:hypothetical protein